MTFTLVDTIRGLDLRNGGTLLKLERTEPGRKLLPSRDYILNKSELLKLIPTEIKGKTLGCWCKPEACHGDVLAELADK
jgi:hypothetical protein